MSLVTGLGKMAGGWVEFGDGGTQQGGWVEFGDGGTRQDGRRLV